MADWKELSGSRKIEDGNPMYLDYVVTLTATKGTNPTRPVQGSVINTATGGAAFGTTNGAYTLDGEPQAVQISEIEKVTPTKSHCTVRYRALYVE